MRRVYEGSIDGRGRRVAIAASRFNRLVTDPLVAGAVSELRRHGVAEDDIDLAWVPGAFELPLAAERLAATRQQQQQQVGADMKLYASARARLQSGVRDARESLAA
ncbi:MAG TPA: 6,7-dimethyl-8-ribityllumazine synthase, partial [Actinomycetes bacterium]|nr:6,7-dimethyl-8-ribityllumazine synthase [Actinomycetes bacterium]